MAPEDPVPGRFSSRPDRRSPCSLSRADRGQAMNARLRAIGSPHEQDPGPGTIRQDRRQLSHLDAACARQEPGAAGRAHLPAEDLARARRRHRRRPCRLHLRAACRAHVGDRHHPGNARPGERRSRTSAASPMCARLTPRPRRCRSRTPASTWSPAASRRITSNSIADFLDEVHRVLKPSGLFAVVDNVVPAGSVGDYVNAFERFRDPSHLRAWTMEEWRAALKAHGFAIGARRAALQADGIQELGGPPRRQHAGLPARDAGAGDARGESHAGAERRQAPISPSACAKACSSPNGRRRARTLQSRRLFTRRGGGI